jgi:hypothetical protein
LHGGKGSAGAVLQASLLGAAELLVAEIGNAIAEAILHCVVHHSETDLHRHLVNVLALAWSSHVHGCMFILFNLKLIKQSNLN